VSYLILDWLLYIIQCKTTNVEKRLLLKTRVDKKNVCADDAATEIAKQFRASWLVIYQSMSEIISCATLSIQSFLMQITIYSDVYASAVLAPDNKTQTHPSCPIFMSVIQSKCMYVCKECYTEGTEQYSILVQSMSKFSVLSTSRGLIKLLFP
jgi:hypothetical protein